MSGLSRIRVALLGLLLAGALAAGCGDLESEGDAAGSPGELTAGTTTTPTRPAEDLPPRPDNLVEVNGRIEGSVTDRIGQSFPAFANRSGLAVQVQTSDTDEEAGFAGLCDGSADVTAASRRITEDELEACARNGLQVIDFQIAYDAIVIVTRNERDVGADCVNLAQLRAMFQAGSPIVSWNQLNPNFTIRQLRAGGPLDTTSDFEFFGARVLGVPGATLANVRADYNAFGAETEIKDFVARTPPGAVAIIGFSFYELFEQDLRPLEIDGQTGDRCVFPSDETIASELYPLERTLRLYTTSRSLDRQEVKAYLRFHITRAEEIADRLELIPLPDQTEQDQLAQIENPEVAAEATAPESVDQPADGTAETGSGNGSGSVDGGTTSGQPDGGSTTTTTTTTTGEDPGG